MNIGMSNASLVKNEKFSVKAKISTNAIALTAAINEVIGKEPSFDESSLGIAAATSYGPLDTYMSSTKKLFSRGIRGLRPQKVVHSVLCEPSCQAGIQNQARAFNMTFCGGNASGFQAVRAAAAALEEGMAENILVIGGDDTESGTVAGAVLLRKNIGAFRLKATNMRFAYDSSRISYIKDILIHELMNDAGIYGSIHTLTAGGSIKEKSFEGSFGGSNVFSALIKAQEIINNGEKNVLILEIEKSGLLGGMIIGK